MNPFSKHLRSFMPGWWRAIAVGGVAAVVILTAVDPQGSLGEVLGRTGVFLVVFWAVLLLLGVLLAYNSWRRYVRPTATVDADRMVESIVASREPYCLILRPFGHDGATILPRWARVGPWSPTLTLEQVAALAIRRSAGIKTYAMVDQNRRLAPPGPVYLRAPHTGWRKPMESLISRAHTILLMLPPGDNAEIRASFAWEIEQITQRNLQSKAVAILPPWNRNGDRNGSPARHQACVILATLEDFAGSIDDTDPLKVLHYDRLLPEAALVAKLHQYDEPRPTGVLCWSIQDKRKRKRHAYPTYARPITEAVRTNNRGQ